MHCLTAWGQWVVQPLQCTAALPGAGGQCNSCSVLPHCLGASGSATPAMHCPTAWGQWTVQLLHYTAALPWGSGQCNFCNALPHCLGAVGSGTLAMHCLTAWGQRAAVSGRSVLQGLWGCRTGYTSLGGRGVLPRGLVGVSCRACGEVESGTPARRVEESCPGGGRSVLLGLWGCGFGHTSLGGWGVQPRGWSECFAGPAGR